MNPRLSTKAFTLTEILVSLVVTIIISAAAWMAVSVLSPASEVTRNHIKAENLLTKSQEELRRIAQAQYDVLETCDFITCGFDAVHTPAQFPGFTRTLTVTSDGTSELKRAHIVVSWTQFGDNKSLDSVVLLARPTDPLSGNVIGIARDAATNAIVDNVRLVLRDSATPRSATTFSADAFLPRPDGLEINYNFAEPGTGRYLLRPGQWLLNATHPGYQEWPSSGGSLNVEVISNEEQEVQILLTPVPQSAHITGRLIALDGTPVNFFNASTINLYRNGTITPHRRAGGNGFDFEIPFTDSNTQCFTLATQAAYRSGLAGNFSCNGFPFHEKGWSSSIVLNGFNCGNPWNGNTASDQAICVGPGENRSQDIALARIPTVRMKGRVLSRTNLPIANAEIFVQWPDQTPWPNPGQSNAAGRSNADGSYEVIVPAVQELFSQHLRLWAAADVPITWCCDEPRSERRRSATERPGPLFAATGEFTKDLVIDTTPTVADCGNLNGNVTNDKPGSTLSVGGATIRVSGLDRPANASGSYVFACTNPALFQLPVGTNQTVTATKSGFYTFTTAGNSIYRSRPGVSIISRQTITFADIGLWPRGTGTIRGHVTNAGTGEGVANITVVVSLGTGGTPVSAVTDSNGDFTMSNVPETWPAPATLGNTRYQQTLRQHTLNIAASTLYDAYTDGPFTLDAGEIKIFDIGLIPRGAF